jgi:PAS domain S-box-containing protein
MSDTGHDIANVKVFPPEKSRGGHNVPAILVVEDDEALNMLIRKKLGDLGFKTDGVLNGQSAIERIDRDQDILLLLDYMLPDMKGEKVILDSVMKMYSFPFIVMTGYGDEKIAVEMMKLGARDYLVKDVSFLELLPEVVGKTMKEISRERKMEEIESELAKNKIKFELLFNHGPDMFFSVHPERGIILECNKAAFENLGYRKNELVGRKILNIYHPDSRNAAREYFREFQQTGSIKGEELVVKRKDGSRIMVELKAEAGRDPEGKIIYSMSSLRDITQRKKAEEEIKKGKDWSESIINLAPNMVLGLDENHRIVIFNKFAEKLTGYTVDEVIGKDWIKLFIPVESKKEILDVFDQLVKGNIQIQYWENQILTRDGEPRLIAWHNRVITGYNRFGMVLSIGSDITEKRKAEDEIVKLNAELEKKVEERTRELSLANEELESFSYSVSHDLRAPLTRMDGFSKALLDNYSDKLDEKAKHYLDRIRISCVNMAGLIDDLLQLSKISRKEFIPGLTDISEIASGILVQLRESEPHRTVITQIEDRIVVRGDPGLLKIMLENLLSNAWKFTRLKPEGLIQIGRQDESIYIQDNGAGIDMKYADQLFKPFKRLHSDENFEGSGIGLTTVKRIVDRHNGKIWVESKPGKGTTFFFRI